MRPYKVDAGHRRDGPEGSGERHRVARGCLEVTRCVVEVRGEVARWGAVAGDQVFRLNLRLPTLSVFGWSFASA